MSDIEAIAAFLREQYKTDAEQADTDYERASAAMHRTLLAHLTAERHLVVEGDDWYTCAAATTDRDGSETIDECRAGGPCDCGRDKRVEQSLRIMAAPYCERPGFKDRWRTLSAEERAQRRW